MLKHKKPIFWVMTALVAVCATAVTCFLASPTMAKADMLENAASAPEKQSAENAAIREAILEHNKYSHLPGYDVACSSFVELGADTVDGDGFSDHIHYGWSFYEEYVITDDGILKAISGSHVPLAITFREEPDGTLTLQEYWEPKDGSYFEADI